MLRLPRANPGITREQSDRLKKSDPRIPVVRCRVCHRLRPHPRIDDTRTWNCDCGSMQFFSSFPHDDELELAKRLYSRDIEEKNMYARVATEIMDEWRAKYGIPTDKPKPKVIIV